MFFSHLVPIGSPSVLSLLLFWIEVVSNLVRPLTLRLRLCANMTADHVLISLISGMFTYLVLVGRRLSLVSLVIGFLFIFFIMFVCSVQALVFVLLLSSYMEEICGVFCCFVFCWVGLFYSSISFFRSLNIDKFKKIFCAPRKFNSF